jgi:hypothetical protein
MTPGQTTSRSFNQLRKLKVLHPQLSTMSIGGANRANSEDFLTPAHQNLRENSSPPALITNPRNLPQESGKGCVRRPDID